MDSETGDDMPDLINDDGGEMQSQLVDTIRHWRTWNYDGRWINGVDMLTKKPNSFR